MVSSIIFQFYLCVDVGHFFILFLSSVLLVLFVRVFLHMDGFWCVLQLLYCLIHHYLSIFSCFLVIVVSLPFLRCISIFVVVFSFAHYFRSLSISTVQLQCCRCAFWSFPSAFHCASRKCPLWIAVFLLSFRCELRVLLVSFRFAFRMFPIFISGVSFC